jgi:hypothetical protein
MEAKVDGHLLVAQVRFGLPRSGNVLLFKRPSGARHRALNLLSESLTTYPMTGPQLGSFSGRPNGRVPGQMVHLDR